MKNYSLLIIAVLQSIIALGQAPSAPEIKAELPNVVPPSPTVAALMKFEEVPVSNYTGIPDISIPLYSTTAKYGLEFNMSLSYHPGSIKKNDTAGYTGLGWSLIAGGSISRTIRDIPDDYYDLGGMFSKLKIGIYHNDDSYALHNNSYYELIDSLPSNYNFDHESEAINRLLFESGIKQHFDTKHDLYQFNFMGHSGRFIIEKQLNGSFEVVKLDKNNLIIEYNPTNDTFQIQDTKGFTYVFDVKEQTTGYSITNSIEFGSNNNIGPEYNLNYDYTSAFQLSKVMYNGDTVVQFSFNTQPLYEYQNVGSETFNMPLMPLLETLEEVYHHGASGNFEKVILPPYVSQNSTTTIQTKKITQIEIVGKAIIDFDILTGITYTTPIGKGPNHCLNTITVKDLSHNVTAKQYKFNYLTPHKLFLDEIKEGPTGNELSKYKFRYEGLDLDYNDFDADYWGYYRFKDYDPGCVSIPQRSHNADLVYCRKDVLKQIIYPTKGSSIFEYESNDYSYIGDDPTFYNDWSQENFDPNPYNWTVEDYDSFSLDNSTGNTPTGVEIYPLFGGNAITTDRYLIFNTTLSDDDHFIYVKKLNPVNGAVISQTGISTHGCDSAPIKLDANFKYSVYFQWVDYTIFASANVLIKEKSRNAVTRKADYGGGIRIKNIYYTDNDAPEIAWQESPNNYLKKISYDYNFFDEPTRSSGALVYPKPILQYESTKRIDHVALGPVGQILAFDVVLYNIFSTTNNLSFISTKGSDVGYKNVTVSESGNGKTEYVYSSPIDFPEIMHSANIAYPYAPSPNIDYKRGLLYEERKYDQLDNKILTQKTNSYSFEEHEKVSGISVYTMPSAYPFTYDCPYAAHYSYYDYYRDGYLDPNTYLLPNGQITGNLLNFNVRSCGDFVSHFMTYYLNKEAYGWAKLDNTVSKDYFYNNSLTPNIVEATTSYTYNNDNMQLASISTTQSNGDVIENKFYYVPDTALDAEPTINDLRGKNMVETLLMTETLKGTTQLAAQKVLYNNWSGLLLPEIIQSSKVPGAFENRVYFNRYDDYGHPLDVQKENGMHISYIWGYHSTQPIAKIENMKYSDINPSLITDAQSKSDASVTGLETDLATALNAIRTALPNAMVTTYTYVPLVGVKIVTDPKGMKQTFDYDSFGRLQAVYDTNGEKVSENHYNYRP